jgi:hypothetical protein
MGRLGGEVACGIGVMFFLDLCVGELWSDLYVQLSMGIMYAYALCTFIL